MSTWNCYTNNMHKAEIHGRLLIVYANRKLKVKAEAGLEALLMSELEAFETLSEVVNTVMYRDLIEFPKWIFRTHPTEQPKPFFNDFHPGRLMSTGLVEPLIVDDVIDKINIREPKYVPTQLGYLLAGIIVEGEKQSEQNVTRLRNFAHAALVKKGGVEVTRLD